MENDDITNDEVFVVDSLSGAFCAANDIDLIFLNFLCKEQELLFFTPITEGLDQASEQNSDEDRGRVDPGDLRGEEGKHKGGQTEGDEHDHVELVELIEQDIPESAHTG